MWAPGAYKNDGARTTAPAPNIGIEKYFFEAGERSWPASRSTATRSSCPSARARSPTCSTRPPATRRTTSGTARASSRTRSRRGPTASSTSTGTDQIPAGFQPCFAGPAPTAATATRSADWPLLNEGRDQAMEFASGNFGMVESAYDYAMDTTAPRTSSRSRPHEAKAPSPTGSTGRRGGGHPLHDRRLHADPRVAEVQQPACRAGSARCSRSPSRARTRSSGSRSTSRATSPRSRPSASSSAQRGDGRRRWHRAGDAGPDVGTPAMFAPFTPGVAKTTRRRRRRT